MNYKINLSIILIFLFVIITNSVSALTNVSTCNQALTTNNEIYKLNNSLYCSAIGLQIQAENMTLDFNGFKLEGTSYVINTGIVITSIQNVTIQNAYITNYSIVINGNSNFLNNLTIKNGTFINRNQTTTSAQFLYLRNTSNVYLLNNLIESYSNVIYFNPSGWTNYLLSNLTANGNEFRGTNSITTGGLSKNTGFTNFSNNIISNSSIKNTSIFTSAVNDVTDFEFINNTITNIYFSQSFMKIYNLTRAIISNNRAGTSTLFIDSSNTTYYSLFEFIDMKNLTFSNNILYLNNLSGLLTYTQINASNIIIENNAITFNSDSNRYGLSCGSDSGGTVMTVHNCTIRHNTINNLLTNTAGGRHTLMMKNNVGGIMYNNTVTKGYYCVVFKNNKYTIAENITCIETSRGFHDKGSQHSIIRNLKTINSTLYGLYLYNDNVVNIPLYNNTYYDYISIQNGTTIVPTQALGNVSVTLVNASYSGVSATNLIEDIDGSTAFVTRAWYFMPTLSPTDATLTITNISGNTVYQNLGWLSDYVYNGTTKIYASPYSYSVSKTGYESITGTFNLTLEENYYPSYTILPNPDKELCEGTLTGLQGFGDFVPLIIIGIVLIVIFGFLFTGNDEGAMADVQSDSVGLIVSIIAIVLGAVIISSMLGGC